MSVKIFVPKRLVDEVVKRGMDVEEAVLDVIAKALNLSLLDIARSRVELAEEALSEAESYLSRGEVPRACERIYKAICECLKALAEKLNVKQVSEARKLLRWDPWMLAQASTDLSIALKEEMIRYAWSVAYEVYNIGFKEARYRAEDAKAVIPLAKWLIEYTKKVLEA